MIIEKEVIQYLKSKGFSVFAETPANPSGNFIVVEKTGGNDTVDNMRMATLAIQCNSDTLLHAAELSETVRGHILNIPYQVDGITKVTTGESYNFTNTKTKQRRYQSLNDFYYF